MKLVATVLVPILLVVFTSAVTADFRCPWNHLPGPFDHPHPESCKKYYRCTSGVAEERICPYRYYFDVVSRSCTTAHNVQCLEGTDDKKERRPICINDGKVRMVPHQMICTRYYLCLGSNALEKRCPEGFLFDADLNKCNFPGKARCHLDPWCPEYDQLDSLKFFPDPVDCSRYSLCYNGTFHQQQCAEGLFFNVEAQECVNPKESRCKINGVRCSNHAKKEPHPSKCSSYYECESGFSVYRECEKGEYFSEAAQECIPQIYEDFRCFTPQSDLN